MVKGTKFKNRKIECLFTGEFHSYFPVMGICALRSPVIISLNHAQILLMEMEVVEVV